MQVLVFLGGEGRVAYFQRGTLVPLAVVPVHQNEEVINFSDAKRNPFQTIKCYKNNLSVNSTKYM